MCRNAPRNSRHAAPVSCHYSVMRYFYNTILLLSLIAICGSCTDDSRAKELIQRAEGIMEDAPDSANNILDSNKTLFLNAGKAVRMEYGMLKTEAEDKLFITHKSDSVMRNVAEYYTENGTPEQQTRAFYLLGRVYRDLSLYGSAIRSFKMVLSVNNAEKSQVIYRYKALAGTWIGEIYNNKRLYSEAIHYNKVSYDYAKKSDRTSLKVYSLRDIGRAYNRLNEPQKAIRYYLQAGKEAKAFENPYFYNMVMEELSSVYIEKDMLHEAYEILKQPFIGISKQDSSSHYFINADYFNKKGEIDSAILYNKKGMRYATKDINADVARDIAALYERKKDFKEAVRFYKISSLYEDSLNKEKTEEYNDFIQNITKMLETESNNTMLYKSRNRLYLLISLIIIVFMTLLLLSIKRFYKIKQRNKEQQEKLKNYFEQKRKYDIKTIEENNKNISKLKKEIDKYGEQISDLQRKLLVSEAEALQKKNELIITERAHKEMLDTKFKSSEIYSYYHNDADVPGNAEYQTLLKALNTAYDRFTYRLQELYPQISNDELWVCCMLKTGLSSKRICSISAYHPNTLSMARMRLYKKIFKKDGSSKDLDKFIHSF